MTFTVTTGVPSPVPFDLDDAGQGMTWLLSLSVPGSDVDMLRAPSMSDRTNWVLPPPCYFNFHDSGSKPTMRLCGAAFRASVTWPERGDCGWTSLPVAGRLSKASKPPIKKHSTALVPVCTRLRRLDRGLNTGSTAKYGHCPGQSASQSLPHAVASC